MEIEKIFPQHLPLVHLKDFINVLNLVTELGKLVQKNDIK